MTDTPNPDEVAATPAVGTDESLGEKIQRGAEELSENPVIKKLNDTVDEAEEFLDEKLHLHHHHDGAEEAPAGETAAE